MNCPVKRRSLVNLILHIQASAPFDQHPHYRLVASANRLMQRSGM